MKSDHFALIRDKVERAYRNEERLHLDADQVRRLVKSPLWAMLAALTAQEIAESWQDAHPVELPRLATTTPIESSLAPSGYGGEPSDPNGPYVGMTKGSLAEAVARAERGQALRAVAQISRRKKRSTS